MPEIGTCGELCDYLATQPRDRKVILSKDAEGNDHSPLGGAWKVMYVAVTAWHGETYPTPEELTQLMSGPKADWWSEEDAAPEDAEHVVVLTPVN